MNTDVAIQSLELMKTAYSLLSREELVNHLRLVATNHLIKSRADDNKTLEAFKSMRELDNLSTDEIRAFLIKKCDEVITNIRRNQQ